MLKKQRRIPTSLAKRILTGKSSGYHSRLFSLRRVFDPKEFTESRGGVVVSKKVAKTAVLRNSLRRRVYAALKKTESDFLPGFAFFIFPKESVAEASPDQISKELATLLSSAGILVKSLK